MSTGLNTALRTSRVALLQTDIDAGGAAGKLKFYDGTRPATGGAATTLLATATLSYPCSAGAAGGVLTLSAIADAPVVAAGTATWGRFTTSADAFVLDCDVGLAGTEVIVSNVVVLVGDEFEITSAVFTEGNP